MNKTNLTTLLTLFFIVFALAINTVAEEEVSPLRAYIDNGDDSYSWKIESINRMEDLTHVVVDLTSQTWLTKEQVDRSVWKHWLEIYVPQQVQTKTALLYIAGGRNGRAAPEYALNEAAQIALKTNNIVAKLGQVPNQKLRFNHEFFERKEDNLIAYSWTQYLKTNDTTWIALLPMVKSAIRAMDAVSEVVKDQELGSHHRVDRFVLTGGSKRGWTAWLAAAMDDRVAALIPIVFDTLNMSESMQHHFKSLGFWSFAIADYVAEGIMSQIDGYQVGEILKVVDPYEYRDVLTMPKYIINSAGDQFFVPDSHQFYWEELSGPKYLRYIPNSDHGLAGTDAIESVATFFWLIANNKELPNITLSRSRSSLQMGDKLDTVLQFNRWKAENPTSRDFRLLPHEDSHLPRGVTWEKTEIVLDEALGWLSEVTESAEDFSLQNNSDSKPQSGWAAYLDEVVLDLGFSSPLKLTTGVKIIPNTLPFEQDDIHRDIHVTFHCAVPAGEDLSVTVVPYMKEQFSTEMVSYTLYEGRDYYSWEPSTDIRLEGKVFSDYLLNLGYQDCIVQLEAGPGATLPPQKLPDVPELEEPEPYFDHGI